MCKLCVAAKINFYSLYNCDLYILSSGPRIFVSIWFCIVTSRVMSAITARKLLQEKITWRCTYVHIQVIGIHWYMHNYALYPCVVAKVNFYSLFRPQWTCKKKTLFVLICLWCWKGKVYSWGLPWTELTVRSLSSSTPAPKVRWSNGAKMETNFELYEWWIEPGSFLPESKTTVWCSSIF